MACVYALSTKAAAEDLKLAASDQARLGHEYAVQAVELIRRSFIRSYFKQQQQVEALRTTPELEMLRSRSDFQERLREMDLKLKASRE
jgi:hypothetical protein